jgi:hypothetical protein
MPNGHGFSFPYGVPLVLYPVLALGVSAGAGKWWGVLLTVAAAALAAIFAWEGLSRKEFEAIHAKDPTLNRLTWRVNWLLFFALPPALVALFGIVRMVR